MTAGSPEADQLLFSEPTVNGAWLIRFKRYCSEDSEWPATCENAVEARYSSDPANADGFSRIGWMLREVGQLQEALSWYQRDWQLDRMRRWQFLRYIELLLSVGQEAGAEECVEDYYLRHAEAFDGWATVAWSHLSRGNREKAYALLSRDCEQKRLSYFGLVRFAALAVERGEWAKAESLIEEAYALDQSLRDGYAGIVRYLFALRRWSRAREILERDEHASRLSPRWQVELAALRLRDGDTDAAVALVKCAYERDAKLVDGFSAMARVFLEYGQRGQALAMFRRDHSMGCLSASMGLRCASLACVVEPAIATAEACLFVEHAYREDAALRDGYSGVARALETAGATDNVRDLYRRDLSLARFSSEGIADFVRFLVRVRDDAAAESAIVDAYARQPELRDGFVAMAGACIERGDVRLAETCFRRDVDQRRASPDGIATYSVLLLECGDVSSARGIVDRTPLGHQARLQFARGTQAADYLRGTDPDPAVIGSSSKSYAIWAAAAAAVGRLDEVKERITAAYRRYPTLSDCLAAAARARLALGDHSSACALFELEWQQGRAHGQSLLQWLNLLPDDDLRRPAVCEAAMPPAFFPRDRWLFEHKNAFQGQTCFIVGTGPSIKDLDARLLKGRTVFAANGAFLLPDLQAQFFVSVSDVFWRHHAEAINQLQCERVFLPSWMNGSLFPQAPTSWMNAPLSRSRDCAGQRVVTPLWFSREADKFVALGGTVVAVCMQLAWFLGFRRVVLLGVDHDYGEGRKEHGATHSKGASAADHAGAHFVENYYRGGLFYLDYEGMDRAYQLCQNTYTSSSRDVLNATPNTLLDVFPKVTLAEAIED